MKVFTHSQTSAVAALKFWEWINSFTTHVMICVISCPWLYCRSFLSIKEALCCIYTTTNLIHILQISFKVLLFRCQWGNFQGYVSWWRHLMGTSSALLDFCGSIHYELSYQRPVTRGFDVIFDLRLNKRLSKQSRRRWFETPSQPLLGHRYVNISHESTMN